MHAVIHHTINDPKKWEETSKRIMSLIEQQRLPKGLKPVQYLPSSDGRKAVCVWEADSLHSLRDFIEQETKGAGWNEYFEVKVEDSVGLPGVEQPRMAKAA